MSKLCCITDLILFMMKKAEKLMKGSVHEEDFFIVHDDLVLMTSEDTIKWMKENNSETTVFYDQKTRVAN